MILNLACTESHSLYKESFLLPDSGWSRETTLEGSWISEQSISHSPITLAITHAPDFGYENLYLTAKAMKNSQIVWTDTFSLQLAKHKFGQWLGSQRGDFWIVTDTLPYSLSLEKGEEFQFQISQFSREDVLKGIEAVEINVVQNLK